MALDYPDQSYFPSWKVRLTVRFEEFAQGVVKSRVPPVPSKNLNGIKQDRAPLEAVPDPELPGRFLLRPLTSRQKDEDASKDVLLPESSSDGLTHVVSGVIPRHFEWKQNGFRTADELTIQIKWVDFPVDPRTIRSCAVEFFLGTLTSVEYASGVAGNVRGSSSEPLNLVPDTYLDETGRVRSNRRFTGWVDKWKMSWSSEEGYVEFQCRDNTQLLLNQLAPARLVLGMKEPIDRAIATYLSNFPQFAGLTVRYVGAPGSEVPKLDGALSGTAFRPQLGPQPSKGSGDDLTVWDYLTDIAGSIGHVVRLDGNSVLVQRAATLLHGNAAARPEDPYRVRHLESGDFPARAFVFGRNVESLEVSRDFANKETKNVEVRCYSTRRKQVLVARYPTKDARIPASTPGDARADNKWTIVRVTGVEDPTILNQIAQDVYHGRNRGEIEVVVKTKNLASFGGGNADPDLLDLKSGDAIEVLVDRSSSGASGEVESRLTAAEANRRWLTDLGYTPEFAAAYAKTYQDAGFQRLYRVREMSVTGDLDEGVSFELRAGNFVQARADVAPTTSGQNPTASNAATQGGGKTSGVQRTPETRGSSVVTSSGAKPVGGG